MEVRVVFGFGFDLLFVLFFFIIVDVIREMCFDQIILALFWGNYKKNSLLGSINSSGGQTNENRHFGWTWEFFKG